MKVGWNQARQDAQNYRDRNKIRDWIRFFEDEIDAELEMSVIDRTWVKERREFVAFLEEQVDGMKGNAPRHGVIAMLLKKVPPQGQPMSSPSSRHALVEFCLDQIEGFLAHLRDLLMAHLDSVDDDNVSDDDLTTTKRFNSRIRLLEVHRLKLLGRYGYDAYDHALRLRHHRHPALWFTPPPLPPTAKDYSDVVSSELRNILRRADQHDRSDA